MDRRRFLELATLPLLAAGCQLDFEQGVFNDCRDPAAGDFSAHPVVRDAWQGLRADRVWDVHVHLFGNGRTPSGIYVDPAFEKGWSPASRIRHAFFHNAACAGKDDQRLDTEMVARLTKVADALPPGAKLMLLAFDHTYDENGRQRTDLTTFAVPNEYAQRIAAARPDRFEWDASVHPYREDAVEALAKAKQGGARAVKWLPPTMGIDLASPRCLPFYDAMVRMDLPLLVHVGEEQAVHGAGRADLANPLFLRKPLDRGVRVIAAHCASLGKSVDLDSKRGRNEARNFALFARLMGDRQYEGRLFGDLSAITQANRAGIVREILEQTSWEGRLLDGSDYPLPGILPLFSLKGLVSDGVLDAAKVPVLRELRETNSVLFDFVLKRNLAWKGLKFPASAFETRDFFTQPARAPSRNDPPTRA